MSDKTPSYMTPACAKRFKEELHDLLYVKRPQMVETVAWAASLGDRSENADYQYGKRALRKFDSRIRFLTKRLEEAIIVDPIKQAETAQGRVLFGATVTVEIEDGDEKQYAIVGVDEIDLAKGRVSWISPIGKALLKARVGDCVTFPSPGGLRELEVVEIQYLPLD